MIRFLTDEHIPAALAAALVLRGLDVVRVEDVGLKGETDPDVLAWAAAEGRVFVTFDRRTVPGFAYDRVRAGLPMPGVAIPDPALTVGQMADELHVLAACCSPDELRDQVWYLPT